MSCHVMYKACDDVAVLAVVVAIASGIGSRAGDSDFEPHRTSGEHLHESSDGSETLLTEPIKKQRSLRRQEGFDGDRSGVGLKWRLCELDLCV